MIKRNGTYSKLFVQLVFAVRYREALLHESWEERLYRYITGILQEKGQIPIAINGCRDHIHILTALKPTCTISDLVREVKKASTEFVKLNHLVQGNFRWQEGYGVFSYSRWDIPTLVRYVHNQKEHHKHFSFRDEYVHLLKDFEIEHEPEYLFEWITEEAA